jgi:hypothetical protein
MFINKHKTVGKKSRYTVPLIERKYSNDINKLVNFSIFFW